MKKLNSTGLLGLNRRNASYSSVWNDSQHLARADDKLKAKAMLQEIEIPVPETYSVIEHQFEIRSFQDAKLPQSFVVKPARGREGRGILVIESHTDGVWRKKNSQLLSRLEWELHLANILAGLYSLGGRSDRVFFEYCTECHDVFSEVTYQGTPDIRILVYRGVPVAGMLRLPTKESDGRANLHQGAIGVGIDMAEGVSLHGVHHSRYTDIHPDTRKPVKGIRIPFWKNIVEIAVKTYSVFQLGYAGVDFVVDKLRGPMILEVNGRPGLAIQLANRIGLLDRLNAVDAYGKSIEEKTWQERLHIFNELLIDSVHRIPR
ncbi:MAG: alpha-L-glutamate ligase-like protein [Omnitrophica bacterium RIFCSPLOWO2_12_FULL_50_11]|nr:MAG: alpha-L-glutamate ligase-like protein [Omnitrophica bacterium RIFCSPLOWO2_12_FULL_50_11]